MSDRREKVKDDISKALVAITHSATDVVVAEALAGASWLLSELGRVEGALELARIEAQVKSDFGQKMEEERNGWKQAWDLAQVTLKTERERAERTELSNTRMRAAFVPKELRELWDEYVRTEEIVESHDHQEFESCSVCGEQGEHVYAKVRYREAALSFIDSLMRTAALAPLPEGETPRGWRSVQDSLPKEDSDVFAAIWWANKDNPAYSHYAIHDCNYYEGSVLPDGSQQKVFTDCEGEEFEHVDVSFWIYKEDLAKQLPVRAEGETQGKERDA